MSGIAMNTIEDPCYRRKGGAADREREGTRGMCA